MVIKTKDRKFILFCLTGNNIAEGDVALALLVAYDITFAEVLCFDNCVAHENNF